MEMPTVEFSQVHRADKALVHPPCVQQIPGVMPLSNVDDSLCCEKHCHQEAFEKDKLV